jgi:cation diffusion facilitator CzcD-associated flavoprotein CzcO
MSSHSHVAIVGTGFGGIATAVQLRRNDITDIVLLERASDVGGVWRDNDYPGAAVDVESNLYSLSFAPNPNWKNTFAKQPELYAYLRDVADRFDLRRDIVFNCTVLRLDWDASAHHWRIQTSAGERTASHVVLATGALADPDIPDLPGLDTFAGASFHSARWRHEVDLTGKRVAAVGTGPSAVQFIPAIQPAVGHLTVFQRTAAWVVPRDDREVGTSTQRRYRAFPILQRLQRLSLYSHHELRWFGFHNPALMRLPQRQARKFLEQQVGDPGLRAKLLPTYRFGCKRVLISDDYLRSLDQPNVDVNVNGIREITPRGIVDDTGVEHAVDVIVFGTGFRTSGLPLTDRTRGVDGRTMAEVWDGSPTAYLGTAVAGFPNCYLIHGPNIGLGHNSVIHMIESQVNYIVSAVGYARERGLAATEPRLDAQREYVAYVDRLGAGSVWTAGGCQSWYLNEDGRNTNIWPGTTVDFRRRTLRFDPDAHVLHAHKASEQAVV